AFSAHRLGAGPEGRRSEMPRRALAVIATSSSLEAAALRRARRSAMAHGPFISAPERIEIRRRILAGERPRAVAAALRRSVGAVNRVVRQEGGVPPPRTLGSSLRLSLPEREEISRRLSAGDS